MWMVCYTGASLQVSKITLRKAEYEILHPRGPRCNFSDAESKLQQVKSNQSNKLWTLSF